MTQDNTVDGSGVTTMTQDNTVDGSGVTVMTQDNWQWCDSDVQLWHNDDTK